MLKGLCGCLGGVRGVVPTGSNPMTTKDALARLAALSGSAEAPEVREETGDDGPKRSFIGLYLDPTLKTQIQALAEAHDVKVSAYIRTLLRMELLRVTSGQRSSIEVFHTSRLVALPSADGGE